MKNYENKTEKNILYYHLSKISLWYKIEVL